MPEFDCQTLSKLFNIPKPEFPQLQNDLKMCLSIVLEVK